MRGAWPGFGEGKDMTFKTDYPQDDAGVTDFLESRQFYELMQKYRHQQIDALAEFEAVKSAIRAAYQRVDESKP